MALHINGPSRKVGENAKERLSINWEEEITEAQAKKILQKKFYPFREVLLRPSCISILSTETVGCKLRNLSSYIFLMTKIYRLYFGLEGFRFKYIHQSMVASEKICGRKFSSVSKVLSEASFDSRLFGKTGIEIKNNE